MILENSIPVGMVVHPLAFKYIAIGFSKLPETPSVVLFPVSFVCGLIWPDLYPFAFSKIVYNVAIVSSSVSEPYYFAAADRRWRMFVDLFNVLELPTFVEFMI